jgi:gustatory receptor
MNKLEQLSELNRGMMFLNGVNTLTYTIYEISHLNTMFIIYFRLSILRKFATSLLHCDVKSLPGKLKVVVKIWDTICDGLDVVKFCCTINTSYYIISFTFNFVFSIYSIVSYFFYENSTYFDMIYMFLAVLWISVFIPSVALMFMVAMEIEKQGSAIENQMHSLIACNFKNKRVLKQIELVLDQFDNRKPKTTCGLFEIDWKLLFFLLGTSFNYLLIIAQFEL